VGADALALARASLIEQLPLICYIDRADVPDAPPLYISPQVEAIFGSSPADWCSRSGTYEAAIHPDDRERVLGARREIYACSEPLELEYRMIAADGRVLWALDESVQVGEGAAAVRQGFVLDITRRKAAEEALQQAEHRFRTLVEQLPLVVYIDALDEVSSNIYTSPQVEQMLGYTAEEWQTNELLFVQTLHPDDRERVLAAHARTHATGESLSLEYRLLHREGHVVWVRDEGRVIKDADGKPHFLQGYLLDISARREAEEELRHQAFHDSLTGLANRSLFTDRLEHALQRQPAGSIGAAVLFLDLDDFKTINDSLGHLAADQLLRATGDRIKSALRSADTVARFGGDEFAVLLDEVSHPSAAARAADRIAQALAAPFTVGDRELFVNASIGIAIGRDPVELLRAADVAMYRVKAGGKGHHAFYEPAMDDAVFSRLELVADLRRAELRNEFVLHYQPTVSLADRRIIGVEALLRWQHPTRGLVLPLEFVSLAEETGLIVPIGRSVLMQACKQVAAWQRDLRLDPPLRLAVNVSARQLQDPGFTGDVAAALGSSGLDPGCLTLELTESVLMQSGPLGTAALRRLRELGVLLALDDFGTGYSSLGYLQELPVQVVKIDRSFVQDLHKQERSSALVRAIIDLGGGLGLSLVAEGVEEEAQAAELRRLGCDVGQGFLFARPLEIEALEELLRDAQPIPSNVRPLRHSEAS
jgi:diguanylate cyclase (GGDEF)-like protein/PAS domain S-box-containing protein